MNPFSINYNSQYFCDREKEIAQLQSNIKNGLNTLIHSPRRLGKTALISHLFLQLETNKLADTIYIDLFASKNMEDLIQALAEKILKKYHRLNFIKGLQTLLKGLMATITLSADGSPQISLNIKENQYNQSLEQLLNFLEKQNKTIVIAFDEFQEIAEYPEKAEAILRSQIQCLKNVKFIFSGSSNHILQQMFQSPKRPFYQSCETLTLGKIERDKYFEFIENCFLSFKQKIDKEAISEILDFTKGYTYYTQVISNHCFALNKKHTELTDVEKVTNDYIESRKIDYQSMLNLLTNNQQKLTIAIAKEEIVKHPNSIDFLSKHKLPSLSSTSQAISALSQREIIYKSNDGYFVYDIFFMRFLQRWY